MKKLFTLFLLVLGGSAALVAQEYPELTIQEIQEVSPENLAACNDSSVYFGDTVTITGTIVMDGGLAQAADGRNVWIQAGTGPFSGIDVFTTGVDVPVQDVDILDLVAGDSIRLTGIVFTFGAESEIIPIRTELIASDRPVFANPITVGDLNDDTRTNNLETGEQWEGAYVEFNNVTVVEVLPFSDGSRVSFNIADENGNLINVSDRFLAQRLPALGGTFVSPTVGTVYDTLRGVVAHSANGCTNQNGRGYELYPFSADDYVVQVGASAPLISGISRTPVAPTSAESATISTVVEDVDGTVDSVILYYAVGVETDTYVAIPMTGNGSTFTAEIADSVYNDGDFIKYYIQAIDNDALVTNTPDVPGGAGDPLFFAVRDNGLTIADVQFTPFASGNSGYVDLEVTVEGVVISSAELDNLGTVFIQQEGDASNGWMGIQVIESPDLAGLVIGDKVQVTGTVRESFGLTQIRNVTSITSVGTGVIEPLVVDPSLFSRYDFATVEQYEGMLVTLASPNEGEDVYIVNVNADAPSNFAEYRVGVDPLDPDTGCRILAGRLTGSAPGSLNFSYVNDSTWATESGIMNVPACVVTYGDTLESMTGVMYYSFSNMKLLPRNNEDISNFRGANCTSEVTSVRDELAGSLFRYFPNPAQDQLTLELGLTRAVNAQIRLIDLMGRTVASTSFNGQNGKIQIPTQALANGYYFLSFDVEGEVIRTEKIAIIK